MGKQTSVKKKIAKKRKCADEIVVDENKTTSESESDKSIEDRSSKPQIEKRLKVLKDELTKTLNDLEEEYCLKIFETIFGNK